MGNSRLRPETRDAEPGKYAPTDGTAYLMVYHAVKSKAGLIHGRLHAQGDSCAVGSFWDVNPQCALGVELIDEIAAVNDSLPNATARQRRLHVLRWLRWKLAQAGMPGFADTAKNPTPRTR